MEDKKKADADNNANQMNPNNKEYDNCRDNQPTEKEENSTSDKNDEAKKPD